MPQIMKSSLLLFAVLSFGTETPSASELFVAKKNGTTIRMFGTLHNAKFPMSISNALKKALQGEKVDEIWQEKLLVDETRLEILQKLVELFRQVKMNVDIFDKEPDALQKFVDIALYKYQYRIDWVLFSDLKSHFNIPGKNLDNPSNREYETLKLVLYDFLEFSNAEPHDEYFWGKYDHKMKVVYEQDALESTQDFGRSIDYYRRDTHQHWNDRIPRIKRAFSAARSNTRNAIWATKPTANGKNKFVICGMNHLHETVAPEGDQSLPGLLREKGFKIEKQSLRIEWTDAEWSKYADAVRDFEQVSITEVRHS